MSYQERANRILKSAIKSAIYIDEKARTFYQDNTPEKPIEEEISVKLYENFKKLGISLVVHRYMPGDEDKQDTLDFFTEKRDLVILDWKLKNQTGEEEALKILSEVIKANHLHFCAIYTSEDHLDIVLKNILSYFSCVTQDYYDELRELVEIEEFSSEIIDAFDRICINRFNRGAVKAEIKNIFSSDKSCRQKLERITGTKDMTCAIKLAAVSLWDTYKSSIPQCEPSFINPDKKIIVINNTIISILKKDDTSAENLLSTYLDHIINDVDSFNQLLGLELHNNLAQTSAIVNHEFVSFNKNALLYHRAKLQEEGLAHFFKAFMNDVLQEKIALSLHNCEYQLLDDAFLDREFEKNREVPNIEEIIRINTFYNSYKLDKIGAIINFGDVFNIEGEESRYLICITPLCDCLRPKKSKSNFYFAEGTVMKDKRKALALGDSAFLSFLPGNIIVRWGDLSLDDENAPYQPLYIKPYQYKIFEKQNTIDENEKIEVHYINKQGEIKSKTLIYKTTIRSNYAQRIANHVFTYPMRVGIDFVKYASEKERQSN